MSNKKDLPLENLSDKFRDIFVSTTAQIREFGDSLYLADFSHMLTKLIYVVDFGDDAEKELAAKQIRDITYETFDNKKEYVDEMVGRIAEKQEKYMQNLFAQGLVFLWARLEFLVKQLITALINFDKEFLARDSLKSIKIPMAKYFGLSDDEKTGFLVDLIFDNICDNKYGIYKLDCYLDAVGLSGSFNERHKRNIIALHQIRNCIVHNDSIADSRFCENCSWMNYQVGDKLTVNDEDFRSYEKSVLAYIHEIFYRLNQSMGAPDQYMQLLRRRLDELMADKESPRDE